MYEYTDVSFGYDENNQEIKEKYVLFKKRPTKRELDNLPITKVYIENCKKLYKYFKTSKITHLKFGHDFNQPVDFLPSSLEELVILNDNYSQDLNNLPVSLKKLKVRKLYKGQILLPKDCVLEKIE